MRIGRFMLLGLLGSLLLAGCQMSVAVRPTTPPQVRSSPPAAEVVAAHYSPDFRTRVHPVQEGPGTYLFDLGRGGAPLIQEVVQARFTRVIEGGHVPPLEAHEAPEAQVVLVPSWKDFTVHQRDASGATDGQAVLELALLRRDGSPVWTRTFIGQASGIVGGGEGIGPLTGIANEALEQLATSLNAQLAQPEVVATLGEVRQQSAARAQAAQAGALRQQARRLYVHPFAGADAGLAGQLQGEVVARLLSSNRVVVLATGAQGASVDEAIQQVNRESTSTEAWVAIGKGKGAELMLSGQLATAGAACTVKVELTDLHTRLVTASFFRPLESCTPVAVSGLVETAVQALLGGL